jgi:hypothetical protein
MTSLQSIALIRLGRRQALDTEAAAAQESTVI